MEPFELEHIKTGGDEMSYYSVKMNQEMTVRQLCDYALAHKNEWGYVEIFKDSPFLPLRSFEYRCGKEVKNTLTDEDMNSVIVSMSASGGWSRMDYTIKESNLKAK